MKGTEKLSNKLMMISNNHVLCTAFEYKQVILAKFFQHKVYFSQLLYDF